MATAEPPDAERHANRGVHGGAESQRDSRPLPDTSGISSPRHSLGSASTGISPLNLCTWPVRYDPAVLNAACAVPRPVTADGSIRVGKDMAMLGRKHGNMTQCASAFRNGHDKCPARSGPHAGLTRFSSPQFDITLSRRKAKEV